MALNYLSGRLSRAAFGIPGFSTNRDLVVEVDGAIGVDTQDPRGSIDTPEISIRGEIIDSAEFRGGLGYFLSQDVEGVRWVAASPLDLTFVRVYENDVQVAGPSSFSGLNFRSPDEFFLNIEESPIGPNIADINYDVRWIKFGYGDNFGIATGFGTDGTYASIPGFGTTEAVGVTSVGIGTNNPQDDFQVGIGSTGVTVNGPEGRVECITLKAQNVEIDGNITVESLVVDPGIATFIGNIDAQGISSFKNDVFIGFASITESVQGLSSITEAQVGFASIGPVGAGSSEEPALFVTGLSTFVGVVTTKSDLYVGNNLYVAGEQFVEQLNANNVLVTGIATINQAEITGVAVTDLAVSGFSTLADYTFNVGIGTSLTVEQLQTGIATVGDAQIGVATIGFASITDANVTGIVTVTEVDVEDIVIERAEVGILTVGTALSVTGFSTFIGFTTFTGDVFVDGDLTVTQQFNVKDLGAENLEVTGIATINSLEFAVGIGTSLSLETLNAGIGTFGTIIAGVGTIGGVGFDSGKITADEIDADLGRIGILTGDQIQYGIGTVFEFFSDVGSISTLSGNNLTFLSTSVINGVFFEDGLVTMTENLEVLGITTFRGVGTFGTDLYVGNDLFVGGQQFIEQINATNLLVTGIATFQNKGIEYTIGIGSTAIIEDLQAHVGVITDLIGSASTITAMDGSTLIIRDPNDPSPTPFPSGLPIPPPPGTAYIREQISEFVNALNRLQSNGDLGVVGFTTTGDLNVRNTAYIEDLTFNVGVGTDLELETLRVGVVTIGEVDIGFASVTQADVGIATIGDLTVTGITTFEGVVNIEDVAFINAEVTGIASIGTLEFNVGIGTSLAVTDLQVGVASVGLASVTKLEATTIEAFETLVGTSTVGFASVGIDTLSGALYVTGINTFIGFTTFTGDVFVDGDFTVTGLQSVGQLDAKQSQIGILTVFERLDSQGVADFNMVSIASTFIASGLSTIGLSTFTPDGDVNINRNLTVGGITTFVGVVNIDNTAFINAEVTGIASIATLFVDTGIATNFSVNNFEANIGVVTDLTVTGASTFIGLSTFEGNVFIEDDLSVSRNVTVGSTIFTQDIDVSGIATINNADIGIATVGFATVKEAFVGVLTTGTLTIETLDVLGVSTFRGDVEMEANLDVAGVTTTRDLVVTGIATINDAFVEFASITDSILGVSTIGIASVGFATVGVDSTTSALSVTGLSTFVGLTTFVGDVFIDGDLNVSGFTSFTKLGSDFAIIGILTVTDFLDANDVRVTGFTTLTDYEFRVGVGSTLSVVDANVSGILSTGNLFIEEDLTVGRNLSVLGITTLGDPLNPTAGFTTVTGDLFVGGDLFVLDDIFYDEIVGKNLLITGIATIRRLEYAVGFGTTANIENLNFEVGIGSTLTVDNINVGVVSVGLVTAGDVIVGGALTVLGQSTFNDIVTIQPELNVQGDLNVTGISSLTQIQSPLGIIDNIIGLAATITDAVITNLSVTGIATAQAANIIELQSGIATITEIDSTTINNAGIITTNLLEVYNIASFESTLFSNDLAILNDLIVNGGSQFLGPVTFSGPINVTGIVTITADIDILGQLTLDGPFLANGISTFTAGLNVEGGPLDVSTIITAPQAQIGTFIGNEATINDLTVLEDAQIVRDLNVGGITTTSNLEVPGQANITSLNVSGIASVGILTAGVGTIDVFDFSSATGTDLFVDFADIDNLQVGVATVDVVGVQTASVGILTVTERLDIEDITSVSAYRVTSNATPSFVAFQIPAIYQSYEVMVQAIEGANFQTTKLVGLNDGTTAFFNEFSDVFNNAPNALYGFVNNGGATEFIISPASANLTTYTITLTAMRS